MSRRKKCLGLFRIGKFWIIIILTFIIFCNPIYSKDDGSNNIMYNNNDLNLTRNDYDDDDNCQVHMLQFIDFKLIFVGIIGTTISIICIIHNSLLFYTFISSSLLRRRNLTYLTCLSLCDIFIGISYIGIMSIQVYSEYFEILPLYIKWHEYLNFTFTISNITLTTASFLLVCATLERYLQTIRMGKLVRIASKHRTIGVLISFIGGIIFRGSIFFEIEVFYKPECEGFSSTGVALSELALYPHYNIFRFWIRRIMTIFVPFFVLAYCNTMIVYSLQENEKNKMVKTLILYMTMGHNGEIAQLRSRVRAATRMLIIVVSCYLCANIIDVVIAFIEYANPESLAEYDTFYTVATDVSSLLSVLSSALRLPIYIANDKLIRQEIKCKIYNIYFTICCSHKKHEKHKAFLTEKRRLVYEQLEYTTSNSPGNNNNNINNTINNPKRSGKISIDSYSGKVKRGIGSLIIARASVVSAMNDNLAVNYDLEKCAVLYERALADNTRLSSSISSDENVICNNPNGNISAKNSITDINRKTSRQNRKKISLPLTTSIVDEIVIENNRIDEESLQNCSKKDETESLNDFVFQSVNSNLVDFKSWYSEV